MAPRRSLGSMRSDPAAAWRHVDMVLVSAVLCLASVGVLMVYSATRGAVAPYSATYLDKQGLYVLLGVGVMIAVAFIDYRVWRSWAAAAYVASCVLLVGVVTALGKSAKGAPRWFQLGGFQLQPSELAKLAVIAALAAFAAEFRGEVTGRRLVTLLALAGVPMALIAAQPDLGSALVVMAVLGGMLLVAGTSGRHFAALAVLAALTVAFALHSHMLADYQKARLTSFLSQDTTVTANPDQAKAKYNVDQSKIAIGAGGLTGEGLFQGTQTRLGQVPEQHTDFIFTAVGEQLGFLGSATVLLLLCVITWRIWRTTKLSRDPFGSMLCVGVLCMLMFQTFENAGMTMGIMPVTGIPLPFMSYGGTAALSQFACIGLVLNIHMRRFR